MTPTQSAHLDDILADWHSFAAERQEVRGYSKTATGCDRWRCSRQYDDANGALDTDLHARTLSTVGRCIGKMDEPYRSAIYEEARNLCTGLSVWQSPRLPSDPRSRERIIDTARENLLRLLKSDGVMS